MITTRYALFTILLIMLFSNILYAEQLHSNIDEIAAQQMSENSSGSLAGCSYTGNILWEGANDLLNVIPGINIFAKLSIAFSKIGNNVACNNNGPMSTLRYMSEIAAKTAKKEVDKALNVQLINETDDLLVQLKGVDSLIDNFTNLPENEKDNLINRLNTIGINASQLEAAGKGLSFEAIPPLTVIAGVKLGACFLAYELSKPGKTKDNLKEVFFREAGETVNILEGQENKLTQYISKMKKHFDSGTIHHLIYKTLWVEARVEAPDGTVFWEDYHQCDEIVGGGCTYEHFQKRKELSNALNAAFPREQYKVRQGIINQAYASIKTKAMLHTAHSNPRHSWFYIMSAQDGRKCLDNNNPIHNGIDVWMWDCDLNNRNQNWIMDDQGYIRSASDFEKCLDPRGPSHEPGTVLQTWDCQENYGFQQFKRYPDNSIRPKNNDQVCLNIVSANNENGASVILSPCNGQKNQQWYWFSSVKSDLNKCMDTSGSTNHGAAIHIWECILTNMNQPWAFDGNGLIRSFLSPHRCLDPRGPSVLKGTVIQMWSCEDNYSYQQWERYQDNTIRPVNDRNMCMDVRDSISNNGTGIQLWPCHSKSNQIWY